MRLCLLVTLIFCLLAGPARAIPTALFAQSPAEQCRGAIVAAERGHSIPPQLMAAIGRVESGHRDPGSGAWGAWPWTINAEGQGSWFETKAEAIRAVEALQARGVRSIDVGCMQVNLMHHPNAFPSLDMAFEPAVNADYAARFLTQLHDQTGDWTRATANYHSANPAEGGPYAAKVTSVWPEEQRKAGLAPPASAAPGLTGPFAHMAQPLPGHAPLSMFATGGKMPMTMLRGETAAAGAGMASPLIAPPGMVQGGTIPVGVLHGGIGPVMQARAASMGGAIALPPISPGRSLDFYRAMPITMAMAPGRMALRMPNRITTR